MCQLGAAEKPTAGAATMISLGMCTPLGRRGNSLAFGTHRPPGIYPNSNTASISSSFISPVGVNP